MSDSVRPHGLQPTRLLRPWDSQARTLEWVAISFSPWGTLIELQGTELDSLSTLDSSQFGEILPGLRKSMKLQKQRTGDHLGDLGSHCFRISVLQVCAMNFLILRVESGAPST